MTAAACSEHKRSERLLWIDLETTGLDPRCDRILEVAMIVTEADLSIVPGSEHSWVLHQPDKVLHESSMAPIVWAMHTQSGLLEESRRSLRTEQTVDLELLVRVSGFLDEGKSPMCGNSIGTLDRPFLRRYMPGVLGWLHYRMVDVSSLKELVSRWAPQWTYGKKKLAHRALDDVRESIDEARWYKEALFGPQVSSV